MLHEAIAAKLRADPSLLAKTRKWLSETVSNELFSQSVRDGYREWEQAIGLCTFDQLLALITDPSEDAIRLRQSTPFVNILTQENARKSPGRPDVIKKRRGRSMKFVL